MIDPSINPVSMFAVTQLCLAIKDELFGVKQSILTDS